ncbi:DUF6164 family protein [Halomonas garicola]|uniref:DUF6164 family protein n=1 Tax=Halomonas garicola TaxID=1690008 RepID=UPI00289EE2E3|nr:DUF6164 family protein [Halomonas garicola]
MARLLFHLRHVTDEEAREVRQLLGDRGFDTYETQAGIFRMGVDAIWLRNEHQLEAAKEALADYQRERLARARQEYADAVQRGEQPTQWRRFLAHPLQVTLVIVAVILIVLITLAPFVSGINPA